MPPVAISPFDAITPAIERTKQLLFKPFNWSRWWRVGLLGLATGEILGSGGCNFGNWGNHPLGGGNGGSDPTLHGLSHAQIAVIITTLVVGVLALVLVHLYISSVLRFVLFSGTINGNYHLRQGWKHWHSRGLRYFGFQLLFTLGMMLFMAPIGLLAWKAISLGKSGNIGAAFAGFAIVVPVVLLVVLCGVIFYVFFKDFCVPLIAIEDLPVPEAIHRVWQMLKQEAGNYAGYLLTKMLLVIVIGIVLFMVQVAVFLVVLIPTVLIAVAVGISMPSLMQNPVVLATAVLAGILLILALLVLFAVIAAPVAAFWQSYVLEFFGSRYEPLWNLLHPAPVIPPIPAVPAVEQSPQPPLEPPPLPA